MRNIRFEEQVAVNARRLQCFVPGPSAGLTRISRLLMLPIIIIATITIIDTIIITNHALGLENDNVHAAEAWLNHGC